MKVIKMLCKLGCFQDLVIMSEVSINIPVDISVWQEVFFISFPLLNTKECDHENIRSAWASSLKHLPNCFPEWWEHFTSR